MKHWVGRTIKRHVTMSCLLDSSKGLISENKEVYIYLRLIRWIEFIGFSTDPALSSSTDIFRHTRVYCANLHLGVPYALEKIKDEIRWV